MVDVLLGGGIPPNRINETLSFGYSTVSESQEKLVKQNVSGWIRSDMAGYGEQLVLFEPGFIKTVLNTQREWPDILIFFARLRPSSIPGRCPLFRWEHPYTSECYECPSFIGYGFQ